MQKFSYCTEACIRLQELPNEKLFAEGISQVFSKHEDMRDTLAFVQSHKVQ